MLGAVGKKEAEAVEAARAVAGETAAATPKRRPESCEFRQNSASTASGSEVKSKSPAEAPPEAQAPERRAEKPKVISGQTPNY